MGVIRFNELAECILTLKEDSDNNLTKIKEIKNNKIDLFSKFIGIDKYPLGSDYV